MIFDLELDESAYEHACLEDDYAEDSDAQAWWLEAWEDDHEQRS